MTSVGKIHLLGMEFIAHHGFYKEEQMLGNRFQVDVVIECPLENAAKEDNLNLTINYEKVYQLIKEVMSKKHKLLETVAFEIIDSLKKEFAAIESLEVAVDKFNPPIGGLCQKVRITQFKKFNQGNLLHQ